MQRWQNAGPQHPPSQTRAHYTPDMARQGLKPRSQPLSSRSQFPGDFRRLRGHTPHMGGGQTGHRPISFRHKELTGMVRRGQRGQRGQGQIEHIGYVRAGGKGFKGQSGLGSLLSHQTGYANPQMGQAHANIGYRDRRQPNSTRKAPGPLPMPGYGTQQQQPFRNVPFKQPRKSHPVQNVFLNSQQSIQPPIRSLSHNTFNMNPGSMVGPHADEKPRSMISRPGNANRGPVRVNNIQLNSRSNQKRQGLGTAGPYGTTPRNRVISHPGVQRGTELQARTKAVNRRSLDNGYARPAPIHVGGIHMKPGNHTKPRAAFPPRRSMQPRSGVDPQAQLIQAMRQSLELNPSAIISTTNKHSRTLQNKQQIIQIHNKSTGRRSIDVQQTPKFGLNPGLPMMGQQQMMKNPSASRKEKNTTQAKRVSQRRHTRNRNSNTKHQPVARAPHVRAPNASPVQARARDFLSSQYRSIEEHNVPQNPKTLVLTDSGGFSEFTVSYQQNSLQSQMPNLKMYVSEKGPQRRMSDFPVHTSHQFTKDPRNTLNFKKSQQIRSNLQKRPRMSLHPTGEAQQPPNPSPVPELRSLDRFSKQSNGLAFPGQKTMELGRPEKKNSALDKDRLLSSPADTPNPDPKAIHNSLEKYSKQQMGSNAEEGRGADLTANRTSLDKSVRSKMSNTKSIKSFLEEKYKPKSLILNYNTSQKQKSRLYGKPDRAWAESSARRKAVQAMYMKSANLKEVGDPNVENKNKSENLLKANKRVFENVHLNTNLEKSRRKDRSRVKNQKINPPNQQNMVENENNFKRKASSLETEKYGKREPVSNHDREKGLSGRTENGERKTRIPRLAQEPTTLKKFPEPYTDSPTKRSSPAPRIFDVSERDDDCSSPTHRESLFQPDISNIQGTKNLRTSLFNISNNLSTIISKMNERRKRGVESHSESQFDESIKDSHHMMRMHTLGNDIRDLESRRSEQADINMMVEGLKESGVFDLPEVRAMFLEQQQNTAGRRAREIGEEMQKMAAHGGSERWTNSDPRQGDTNYKSNFAKHGPSRFGEKKSQFSKPKNEESSQNMSNLIYSRDESSFTQPGKTTSRRDMANPDDQNNTNTPVRQTQIKRIPIDPAQHGTNPFKQKSHPQAPANSPAPTRLKQTQDLEAKGFKRVGSPTMRSQNSTHLSKPQNVRGQNLIRRLSRNVEGQRHSNAVSWAQLNQNRHFKTMPAEKSFSQHKNLGEALKGKEGEDLSQVEYMMWDNGRSNSQIWHKKREYTYEFNDLTYGAKPPPGSNRKSHFGAPATDPEAKPKPKKKKLKLKKKAPKKLKKSKTPKKPKKKKRKKSKTAKKGAKKGAKKKKPGKKKRTIIRRKKTVTRYVKGKGGKRQRKSVVTTTIEKVPKKKTVKGKKTTGDQYITTVQKSVVVGGSIRNSVIQTSSTYHPEGSVQESLVTDGSQWPKFQNGMKVVKSRRKIRGGSIDAGLTRSSIQFKTTGAHIGREAPGFHRPPTLPNPIKRDGTHKMRKPPTGVSSLRRLQPNRPNKTWAMTNIENQLPPHAIQTIGTTAEAMARHSGTTPAFQFGNLNRLPVQDVRVNAILESQEHGGGRETEKKSGNAETKLAAKQKKGKRPGKSTAQNKDEQFVSGNKKEKFFQQNQQKMKELGSLYDGMEKLSSAKASHPKAKSKPAQRSNFRKKRDYEMDQNHKKNFRDLNTAYQYGKKRTADFRNSVHSDNSIEKEQQCDSVATLNKLGARPSQKRNLGYRMAQVEEKKSVEKTSEEPSLTKAKTSSSHLRLSDNEGNQTWGRGNEMADPGGKVLLLQVPNEEHDQNQGTKEGREAARNLTSIHPTDFELSSIHLDADLQADEGAIPRPANAKPENPKLVAATVEKSGTNKTMNKRKRKVKRDSKGTNGAQWLQQRNRSKLGSTVGSNISNTGNLQNSKISKTGRKRASSRSRSRKKKGQSKSKTLGKSAQLKKLIKGREETPRPKKSSKKPKIKAGAVIKKRKKKMGKAKRTRDISSRLTKSRAKNSVIGSKKPKVKCVDPIFFSGLHSEVRRKSKKGDKEKQRGKSSLYDRGMRKKRKKSEKSRTEAEVKNLKKSGISSKFGKTGETAQDVMDSMETPKNREIASGPKKKIRLFLDRSKKDSVSENIAKIKANEKSLTVGEKKLKNEDISRTRRKGRGAGGVSGESGSSVEMTTSGLESRKAERAKHAKPNKPVKEEGILAAQTKPEKQHPEHESKKDENVMDESQVISHHSGQTEIENQLERMARGSFLSVKKKDYHFNPKSLTVIRTTQQLGKRKKMTHLQKIEDFGRKVIEDNINLLIHFEYLKRRLVEANEGQQTLLSKLADESRNKLLKLSKETKDEVTAFNSVIQTIGVVRSRVLRGCGVDPGLRKLGSAIAQSRRIVRFAADLSRLEALDLEKLRDMKRVDIHNITREELNEVLQRNKQLFLAKERLAAESREILGEIGEQLRRTPQMSRFASSIAQFAHKEIAKTGGLVDFLNKLQEQVVNKLLQLGVNDIDEESQEGVKNLVKELVRREKNVAEVMQVRRRKRRKKSRSKQSKKNSKSKEGKSPRNGTRAKPQTQKFQMIKNQKNDNFTERKANPFLAVTDKKKRSPSTEIKNVEEFFLSMKKQRKSSQESGENQAKAEVKEDERGETSELVPNQRTRSQNPHRVSGDMSGNEPKRLSRSRPKKPPMLSRDNSLSRRQRSVSQSSDDSQLTTTGLNQADQKSKFHISKQNGMLNENKNTMAQENILADQNRDQVNPKTKPNNDTGPTAKVVTSESESEERNFVNEDSEAENQSESLIKTENMEVRRLTSDEESRMRMDGKGLRFSLLSHGGSAGGLESSGGAILIQGLESSKVSQGMESPKNLNLSNFKRSKEFANEEPKIQIVDTLDDPYDMESIKTDSQAHKEKGSRASRPKLSNMYKNELGPSLGSRPSQRITFGPKCTLESITGIPMPHADVERTSDIKSSIFSFRNLTMLSNESLEGSQDFSQSQSRHNSNQSPGHVPGGQSSRHKVTKSSEFKKRRLRNRGPQRGTSLDKIEQKLAHNGSNQSDKNKDLESGNQETELMELEIPLGEGGGLLLSNDNNFVSGPENPVDQVEPGLIESRVTLKKETSGGKILRRSSDLGDSNTDYNYSDENSMSLK